AMVLSYFGRRTRVAECRTQCDGGRDGVTARTLVRAARQYGLNTRAFAMSAEGLSSLNTPAILYWNSSHFVVLESYTEDGVQIVDPATGRRCLTAEAFRLAYSEVVLTFEPGAQFETRTTAGPSLSLTYLRQLWLVPGINRLIVEILV